MNQISHLFFIISLAIFSHTLTAFNISQLAASAAYKIKLGALWNLEQMTWCRLGISAGISFNDYGCWCGRGGAGRTVDGIDACCLQHDLCYGWIQSNGQCSSPFHEYISQYEWNCTANNQFIECMDGQSKQECGRRICHCDRQLVLCWATLQRPQCKKQCQTGACEATVNSGNSTEKNKGILSFFENGVAKLEGLIKPPEKGL